MNHPAFLIIGAAKSGTTALFHALGQHPGLYASAIRETNFFAYQNNPPRVNGPGDRDALAHTITREDQYRLVFEAAPAGTLSGEASPLYLYHEEAPARILEFNPAVKLVAVLRDPVERAYSSYLHLVRDGREPCASFEEALEEEPKRINEGWEHLWHYVAMGRYATQLQRYDQLFDANQLRVYLYEDFRSRPDWLFRDLFQFLGVDPDFNPVLPEHLNKSGVARSQLVHRLVSRTSLIKSMVKRVVPAGSRSRLKDQVTAWNLQRPLLAASTRSYLQERFRNEVELLEHRLGRDLQHWLRPVTS